MIFTARSFSDAEGDWVHFRVSEAESPQASAEQTDGDGSDSGSSSISDREIDIVAVDGRLSPWQFALSSDRFESLRPRTEDLLVEPDEPEN